LKLPLLFEVAGVLELSGGEKGAGLHSPVTPTLWGELHGPAIHVFPGSMPKSRQSWEDGALSPAIPCVEGAIESRKQGKKDI